MNRLKLVALDEEDLDVISAHVQDSVLKATDIAFDKKAGKLAMALNRFVWEGEDGHHGTRGKGERRRAMLHFDRVNAVRSRAIDRSNDNQVLSLLAVQFLPGGRDGDPAGKIELVFAGDASAMLDVECVEARLTDTDASWEARGKPEHFVGGRDS